MVANPEMHIPVLYVHGAHRITFHIEIAHDILKLINMIKHFKLKVGIAVNPDTNIDVVFPYLKYIDMVLIMTVNPGFGGQTFIDDTINKINTLRDICPHLDIQVDGGINNDTIDKVANNGANIIVSGSAIINSVNVGQTIDHFRNKLLLK